MGRHSRVEVSSLDDGPSSRRSGAEASAGGGTSGGAMARRVLAAFLAVAGVAALVGLAVLWPRGEAPEPGPGFRDSQSMAAQSYPGRVAGVTTGACGSPDAGVAFDETPQPAPQLPQAPQAPGVPAPSADPGAAEAPGAAGAAGMPGAAGDLRRECDLVIIDIDGGPDEGRHTLLEMSGQPGEPELEEGTKIHLTSHAIGGDQTRYAFLDINRATSVWAWVAVTALAIVVVAAWRGVRAIAGLVLTLAVVGFFLIPALLRGGPPVALSLVTGAVVLFPVMFLVHGVNWKSAAALGGTLTSLAAAAGLAHLAIGGADLRGLADDSNLLIQLYLPAVSVTGLMLAGFIVGALGVLNDVTIAQASTVTELAEADPDAGPLELFASAMRVGRDHIASMVYTLVLAYVGASLPMTLLLSVAERPLMQVLTSDIVATELLRSAIGALGLTLAVPVTTAIAAVTAQVREQANAPAQARTRA
ncbi:YibE/F family protein [Corynebacterium freneyi]|uniref:Membrane protein n=1 Tax=Corynebacterium freneyi TaxID=134034 RepID=A0ABS4U4C4_9CORY|nr:YibE/F family protein [Corynebacterium freneyi]MBP2331503.1 putative membrane protein [Corynebacterium freneyi]WJZ06374.1 YibE/F-like protein [Corynebacterium freneyi]